MASSITQKVLIDLETQKAQEEMKKLAKAGGATADTIRALDARAKELEKSLNSIKAATPTGAFDSFKGAMKGIGDLMTPLNQGLALASKGLRFAEEGLAAYAKTSKAAASDVRKLTNEFSYYKDVVMEGVGAVTVELAKSAVSFDQAMQALRRGGEKGFGKAYGDITKEWDEFGKAAKRGAFDLIRSADKVGERFLYTTDLITKSIKKTNEDAFNKAIRLREEYRKISIDFIGGNLADSASNRAIRKAAADRAAFQADIDRDVNAQISIENSQNSHDYSMDLSLAADALNEWREAAKALDDERSGKNLLKSVFGSIDELSLYRQELSTLLTVVDGVGNAVASSYEAIVTGQGSVSAAFKKVFSDQLLTLGKSSVVEAIKETALGFGALASYQYPAAALHFKSAALHGAVAIAAGAGAAVLGAGSSSGSTASGGGGSISSTGVGGGSYGNGQSQSQGERIIVVMNSSASQSPRMEYLEARRVTDLAFGGDGVTDR